MKKRIGKFFIILGVIFFCLTPFYSVHGEDYYHYNTFNVLDDQGNQIGSGEYVLYQDFMVAHERTYVSEITINFAAYYRGPVTVARRTIQSDYILVEGASISSGSDSNITFWLAGSNYVHIKWYSASDFNYSGYYPLDVFTTGLTLVEMSPGESRQEIVDALDTSNGNWTSLLQQIETIKGLFGVGSIQNVDVDSIRGMLNTVRSEILAIGVLDGVIAAKVAEISDVVDNLEAVNTQLTSVVTLLAEISDNMSFDVLSDKMDELISAIDQLSGSFNITNNVTVENHNIPQYQYNAINVFLHQQYSYLIFDELDLPYFRPNQLPSSISSDFVTTQNNTDYIICFITNNTGVNINIDGVSYNKQPCPSPDQRYYRYVRTTIASSGTHTITFRGTKDVRFYPIYVGPFDQMPNDVRLMYGLPLSGEYSSLLNSIYTQLLTLQNFDDSDILDAIDDLADLLRNLSIDNSVSHETIITTINNFDLDIDTVHNVEVNIKNSFNTYRQRFNNTDILDDTSWFSPVLFNYLFNGIWSNHIPWVITLILFCSLILAMLGLRK